MAGVELSEETEIRVHALFIPEDREAARALLREECGNNLFFPNQLNAVQLERFRFAALKLSGGDMDKLRGAVKLAKEDWRDLLMSAGFGDDIHAHLEWAPVRSG